MESPAACFPTFPALARNTIKHDGGGGEGLWWILGERNQGHVEGGGFALFCRLALAPRGNGNSPQRRARARGTGRCALKFMPTTTQVIPYQGGPE